MQIGNPLYSIPNDNCGVEVLNILTTLSHRPLPFDNLANENIRELNIEQLTTKEDPANQEPNVGRINGKKKKKKEKSKFRLLDEYIRTIYGSLSRLFT